MDRIHWARSNPVACPLPETTIHVRKDNPDFISVSCCCNLVSQPNTNWNDFLHGFKINLEQGHATPACALCYKEEAAGNQSERIKAILQLPQKDFDAWRNRASIDHCEVHINLGNLCPLACRTCQSSESTTYGRITGVPASEYQRPDILADADSFNWIQQQLIHAYHGHPSPTVHLIGGETLVQPGLEKILDWLIDQDMAQRFTVAITTSLAVHLGDKLRDKFSKFYHLGLSLSIDSVGENYHYMRWPVKFSKIEQNLEIINKWRSWIPRLSMSLNPVISLGNVFYIDDYLDFWADKSQSLNIWPTHMHWPEFMCIENMAPQYQPTLLKYLDKVCEHPYFSSGHADSMLHLLQSVRDANRAQDDVTFRYAMAWMADYDRRTGLMMSEHNARLWEMLSDSHRQIYLSQRKQARSDWPINQSVSLSSRIQIT